jgi:hypothetical protein
MATRVLYGIYRNSLNNCGRASCKKHPCKVLTNLAMWFRRIICLKKLLTLARTDRRTIDDGQWAIKKAHLENIVLRRYQHEISWVDRSHSGGVQCTRMITLPFIILSYCPLLFFILIFFPEWSITQKIFEMST